MQSGELGFAALLKTMARACWLPELPATESNAVTGDYSRGRRVFWWEHGRDSISGEEIAIAGNLKEMYRTSSQWARCTGSSSRNAAPFGGRHGLWAGR